MDWKNVIIWRSETNFRFGLEKQTINLALLFFRNLPAEEDEHANSTTWLAFAMRVQGSKQVDATLVNILYLHLCGSSSLQTYPRHSLKAVSCFSMYEFMRSISCFKLFGMTQINLFKIFGNN